MSYMIQKCEGFKSWRVRRDSNWESRFQYFPFLSLDLRRCCSSLSTTTSCFCISCVLESFHGILGLVEVDGPRQEVDQISGRINCPNRLPNEFQVVASITPFHFLQQGSSHSSPSKSAQKFSTLLKFLSFTSASSTTHLPLPALTPYSISSLLHP